MSFPKIPRQLLEEIIFPKELKRFRYEEVISLNFIGFHWNFCRISPISRISLVTAESGCLRKECANRTLFFKVDGLKIFPKFLIKYLCIVYQHL